MKKRKYRLRLRLKELRFQIRLLEAENQRLDRLRVIHEKKIRDLENEVGRISAVQRSIGIVP